MTAKHSAKIRHFDPNLIYHIFPLGFCDAPHHNDGQAEPVARLLDLVDQLDRIRAMGVDTILLGPVFESESHGYDTIDYRQVDRRLGTNDTLKTVSNEIHRRGMHLVFDAVFNHVGRRFPYFMDVQLMAGSSRYADWFANLRFTGSNRLGDPFQYEGWQGHLSLVKLNAENPEVTQYLLDVVRYWVEEFDVDGLRLDAADCLTDHFMLDLAASSRSLKSNFWLMGEVVNGDYRRYLGQNKLDSVTNYEGYKSLYSSQNDGNYHEIAYSLNRCFGESGIYNGYKLANFVDNHDVSRIRSILKDTMQIVPVHILLMTMPGVPSIYYGSEWGVSGVKGTVDDWHLRPSKRFILEKTNQMHPDLEDIIRKLSIIRIEYQALRNGSYEQLLVKPFQLAFMRQTGDQRILVAVNGAGEKVELEIPGLAIQSMSILYGEQHNCEIRESKIHLFVPAHEGMILRIS